MRKIRVGKPPRKTRSDAGKRYAETHAAIMAAVRADFSASEDEISDKTGYHPNTVRKHMMAEFVGFPYLNRDIRRFIAELGLYDEFMAWREAKKKPNVPIFETDDVLSDFILKPRLTCVG